MGGHAEATLRIDRPRQVQALVSPVRQEIVDAVAAGGECTIAELGAWLGRRPDALYYHVAALLKTGLLVRRGRRRAGRRFAAVYDVPGRPMRISVTRAGRRGGGIAGVEPDVARVVGSALRLASRDFSRAIDTGTAIFDGPRRNTWGGRVRGWVRDEDLPRVERLITRLRAILRHGAPGNGAKAHAFAYAFTPLSPTRAKAAGGAAPRGNRSRASPRKKGNT